MIWPLSWILESLQLPSQFTKWTMRIILTTLPLYLGTQKKDWLLLHHHHNVNWNCLTLQYHWSTNLKTQNMHGSILKATGAIWNITNAVWSNTIPFRRGKLLHVDAPIHMQKHLLTLGKSKLLNWLSLLTLGRSQLFYWLWARCPQATKKWRTRHRIWHKSFSMIQWAVIKNWVFLLLNKQTSIRVQLLSIYNTFCWFVQQNKICMVRIKTKSFT